MTYQERIQKIAMDIANGVDEEVVEGSTEKIADEAEEMDIVEKEAMEIIEYLEKEAAEEEARLSDKAVDTLGLTEAEKKEESEEEEEDDEEKEEDEEEEKKASDNIAVAQSRLAQAFSIEKEANEALAEAQLIKVAAARVLARSGAIEESDVEKIASLSYSDL